MTDRSSAPRHSRWGLYAPFVIVLGLLVTVSCQALSRLTGASAPWTEELSRFLFIWTAFLGMASGAFAAAVPQGWTQGTRPASSSPMILPVISS